MEREVWFNIYFDERSATRCPVVGVTGLRSATMTSLVDNPSSSEHQGPHSGPAGESSNAPDPERWVEDHGDYLFRFALVRLRDDVKAEDMVQETFLAALRGGQRFEGRSAERTWLAGILKNKIFDYFRRRSRETSFTDLDFYSDEERERFISEGVFTGGWIHELGPQQWSTEPGAGLDSLEFWKTFHDCSSKMPGNVAAVFTMREVDGVESKEICKTLNISESNLWVMLHRARMALRRCLEVHWFGKGNAL